MHIRSLAVSFLLATVPIAGATASVAAPDSVPSSAPTMTGDRAVWLVGTWNCKSINSSIGTRTFARRDDGSIVAANNFRNPRASMSGVIRETYTFDSKTSLWTLNDSVGINATAPPWIGERWEFKGLQQVSAGGARAPVRLSYTYVDENTFRISIADIGQPISGSTCERAPNNR
jgi:hypothetical protein